MSVTNKGRFLATTLLCASALLAYGCVEESDSDDDAAASMNYNGPGSKWDIALDDGLFAITKRAAVDTPVVLTVGGTYQRTSAGFLVLTVAASEGDDGPAPGDQAWAIEVPGYALILKPMESDSDQVIPMVVSGSCPESDFMANWVIVKKASSAAADDADRDFFGTFSYVAETETASLPARRALANNFQDGGAQALSGGDCEDGIMSVDDAVMYLTANGGAIVHTGLSNPSDASFIFGLAQKAIDSVASLDGSYAGALFDDSAAAGQKIAPVALTCTAGTCSGNIVTDVATGAVSAESVTVTLSGTADGFGPGLITGTISDGVNSGTLACMADRDVLESGRRMISCVGQSPDDNTNMFNVLFVSAASG